MAPRTRLFVNILAWLAFLLVAPFLISYSMGHRFTPISPNSVTVGTFLLRTIPSGADVFLNDKKAGGKTPSSIQNLLPGSYNLRISKDGYRDWQKNLPIVGTMVTDARDVRLLPVAIEEDVMRGSITNFFISPKRQKLCLIEQTKSGFQARLVPFNKYADAGTLIKIAVGKREKVSVLWSPSEDNLILTLTSDKSARNFLVNTATGKATALTPDDAKIFGWVATLTDEKLVKLKQNRAIIAPLNSTGTETLSQTTQAISFSDHGFALLENNNGQYNIRTFSQSGNEQDQIAIPEANNNIVSEIFYSPAGDIALLAGTAQNLIVWDSAERIWRNVSAHAENVRWSPEGDKIAWQESEFDLWVMNLHEKRTLLTPYVPELIARLSTAIRAPFWYAGSHQILFFEKDVLKIADLDPRDGHRIENLISTNRGDGTAEVIQNGDEIIATVQREKEFMLSRFFMLEKSDR